MNISVNKIIEKTVKFLHNECFNKIHKVCEVFLSYSDVKCSVRFMRDQVLQLGKSDVQNLVSTLNILNKKQRRTMETSLRKLPYLFHNRPKKTFGG